MSEIQVSTRDLHNGSQNLNGAADEIGGVQNQVSNATASVSNAYDGQLRHALDGIVGGSAQTGTRLQNRAVDLGNELTSRATGFEAANEIERSTVLGVSTAYNIFIDSTPRLGGVSFLNKIENASSIWIIGGLSSIAGFLSLFFTSSKPEILLPIPETRPNSSQQNKSELGKLMEKFEQEKQEEAKQKAALDAKKKDDEGKKAKYISQFPARDDDGTFLSGQEKNDSCAIASTKMVIKQVTGVEIKESDLRTASNDIDGGYHNKGTWGTSPSSLDDLVNTKYGDAASANYESGQTIGNLESAIGEGKGIVVSVKISEWIGGSKAHSVTVVGITTENDQKVILVNDPWPPGTGKRLSVPVADFERAWYGDAMYVAKKP